MKLNSKIHGAIDYGVVLFLLLSPYLFGLPPMTAKFTYALGIIHLLLTLATDFEAGMVKWISFRLHGRIELAVSIALVGVAFYLGNEEGMLSKIFYLCFAAAVFLTWLATDYKSRTRSGNDEYV